MGDGNEKIYARIYCKGRSAEGKIKRERFESMRKNLKEESWQGNAERS